MLYVTNMSVDNNFSALDSSTLQQAVQHKPTDDNIPTYTEKTPISHGSSPAPHQISSPSRQGTSHTFPSPRRLSSQSPSHKLPSPLPGSHSDPIHRRSPHLVPTYGTMSEVEDRSRPTTPTSLGYTSNDEKLHLHYDLESEKSESSSGVAKRSCCCCCRTM